VDETLAAPNRPFKGSYEENKQEYRSFKVGGANPTLSLKD